MSRQLVITIAIFSTLGVGVCQSAAVADSVPSWDVTGSCRGAAEAGYMQDSKVNLQRCLDSEQRTREQLNKNWATFPAADRVKCVKTQTFSQTYSELATCLEMQRDLESGAKPAAAVPERK
ncbi:MAG: hypothetical protein WBG10_13340 [Pseudolabrys sp.]